MKDLKDYIFLYIMCEVIGQYDGGPRKGYLTGVTNGGTEVEIQFFEEDGINVFEHPEFNTIEEVKLPLRPLWDIKENEAIEFAQFYCKSPIPKECKVKIKRKGGLIDKDDYVHLELSLGGSILSLFPGGPHGDKAEAMYYLQRKGFDTLGLIRAGIAFDKTKPQP